MAADSQTTAASQAARGMSNVYEKWSIRGSDIHKVETWQAIVQMC